MKDSLESTAVGQAREAEGFGNRKLIRPTLPRENRSPEPPGDRRDRGNHNHRKLAAPEQTHAENFYYQKQIQSRTPMVIVLQNGESLRGVLEWYDKNCIKLSRNGHPNMLVYKSSIKYMFKEGEERH